ncbi:Protein of unknown function, partial [Gryllus bimaculatus]
RSATRPALGASSRCPGGPAATAPNARASPWAASGAARWRAATRASGTTAAVPTTAAASPRATTTPGVTWDHTGLNNGARAAIITFPTSMEVVLEDQAVL